MHFGQLLKRGLKLFGDFFFNLERRCARIGRENHGFLDREGRVFETTNTEKGLNTPQKTEQDNDPGQDGTFNGQSRQGQRRVLVGLAHDVLPARIERIERSYRHAVPQRADTRRDDIVARLDTGGHQDFVVGNVTGDNRTARHRSASVVIDKDNRATVRRISQGVDGDMDIVRQTGR